MAAQVNDFNLPTGPGNALKVTRVDNNRYVIVGKSYGRAFAYKVNRSGQPVKIRTFTNIIGGTWSEFTDMVEINGAYYMVGACDDCITGDPGRKIVVVKTDEEFKTLKVSKLNAPMPSNLDEPLGWSKIEADGNDIVVMSQLALLGDVFGGSPMDTLTNFALTRMDENLDIKYHRRYDYDKFDNIGDLKVHNGSYYAMAWNPNYGLTQPLFGIGSEETALHVIEPATGDIQTTYTYDGVGLVLSDITNSTDLAIGGAVTTSMQAGPQASIMRIDANTGIVKMMNSFGNNGRVDAIVELQRLSNGNLLASGAMNMNYPNLNQLLNSSITNFNQLVNPRDARVYRINGTTLATIGNERVLPKQTSTTNIMSYSLLPLSADGLNFISVGYRFKNAYFYSRLPVPACRPTHTTDETADEAIQRNGVNTDVAVTMEVYPNPTSVGAGTFLTFTGELTGRNYVQIYDNMGRMIEQSVVDAEGRYQMLETAKAGFYMVRVINEKNESITHKVIVE